MKKHIICSVICAAFVFGAWRETVSCQNQPAPQLASIKAGQSAALKLYVSNVFPYMVKGGDDKGDLQRVTADHTTGEVWLLAMRHRLSDKLDDLRVGLISNSLQNTAYTDWTGVVISGTFEVYKCEGKVEIWIKKAQVGEGGEAHKAISAPGTYTLTSGKFDMRSHVKYWAVAEVRGPREAPLNVASVFYGKVTDIKFIFP